MKTDTYYVLSISTQANTFGYFGVILLSPSGHGIEALFSPYQHHGLPKRGACFVVGTNGLQEHGFVSGRSQGYTTPAKAKRVINATLQRENQTA